MGAVRFASELLEKALVAVAPGVGFGPGGEGYVRFALVESDERTKKACAAIGAYLKSTSASGKPGDTGSGRVDKATALK
jgi:alanine-synthesizing transaminase